MPDWRARAACKRADPRLFDAPDKPGPDDLTARYAPAAKFCARCPVRAACLAEAYAQRDTGFRGGVLLLRHNQSAAKPQAQPTGPQQLAPCGTWGAYQRHKRRGEEPCESCEAAARERWRRIYKRNPPDLRPCGTPAAYRRHLRAKETPCQACLGASRRLRADYRAAMHTSLPISDSPCSA